MIVTTRAAIIEYLEAELTDDGVSTGVLRVVVVPSPSWENEFQPQHFIVPLNVTAHV